MFLLAFTVREHIPLEQGLRPTSRSPLTRCQVVREHIPLEQGLRRCCTLIL